jgi:GntR family transcriptional regulator, rspAB operon transcriptional repressor
MNSRTPRVSPTIEKPRPIWAQTYDFLRKSIVTLKLAPGVNLSESEIAEQLSISRTPVREAFIRLSEEGFVDIYPQYGTFVAPIRTKDVLHAQFVRVSLECALVRDLAGAARPETIEAIRSLVQKQKAAIRAGDIEAFYSLDEAMHQAMSGELRPVWRFVEPAKMHVDRVRHLMLPKDIRARGLVQEHERILSAIEAGDVDAAEAAMRDHLDGLVRGLDEFARRHPDFFDTGERERPARVSKGAS